MCFWEAGGELEAAAPGAGTEGPQLSIQHPPGPAEPLEVDLSHSFVL